MSFCVSKNKILEVAGGQRSEFCLFFQTNNCTDVSAVRNAVKETFSSMEGKKKKANYFVVPESFLEWL